MNLNHPISFTGFSRRLYRWTEVYSYFLTRNKITFLSFSFCNIFFNFLKLIFALSKYFFCISVEIQTLCLKSNTCFFFKLSLPKQGHRTLNKTIGMTENTCQVSKCKVCLEAVRLSWLKQTWIGMIERAL